MRDVVPHELEAGRVAVVTGGASGIGFAIAEAAAGRGMRVVLVDIRAQPLVAAAASLAASGADVTTVVADVAQVDQVERVAVTAFGLGSVQLVCSNAGVVTFGRVWEQPAREWERVMGVNFMATVHLVRAFFPKLIEHGAPADLLVTGSMASVTARPEIGPYVAAKHALLGLCESLDAELASLGAPIGVTMLIPGKVATGMSRDDHPEAIRPEAAAEAALAGVVGRRLFVFTHPERMPEVHTRFARWPVSDVTGI